MAIYVLADIHGARKALDQCLEKVNFNNDNDTLIQLGDIADGWNEVYQCVERLLQIKNLISIRGNHDEWFLQFMINGEHPASWNQGGFGTLQSYCNALDKMYYEHYKGCTSNLLPEDLPHQHYDFFLNQKPYYIDDHRNCFVHGGFNRHHTMLENESYEADQFWWDRDLWMSALSFKQVSDDPNKVRFIMKEKFKEVFIGHTPTLKWKTDQPMHAANIWNLDTGAGFKGRLTIMNLETKEYFQSDLVNELYPNQSGRN